RLVEITPQVKHIEVPISKSYGPNVYASLALVQGRTGPGPRGKPLFRMGLVNLPVKVEGEKLEVAVKTDQKENRPGDEVKATVRVTGNGKPVRAEVSLVAADEGVLSLVGFKTPNPSEVFYGPWGLGVQSATQYERLIDIPGPEV